MKKVFLVSILSFLCCVSINTFATPKFTFDHIVFFGDSLTDSGNIYRIFFKRMPKSPPYFDGRFSNGPIWSDKVSNDFAEKYAISARNYAYGGETILFHKPTDGYLPYNFSMSIKNYLFFHPFENNDHILFVVWLGANDYLNGVDDIHTVTANVAFTFKKDLELLISKGARNFLILNLPDLGKSPYCRSNHLESFFNLVTTAHNQKLATVIAELKNENKEINMHLLDMDVLIQAVIKNTIREQQTFNLTEACWKGGYWSKPKNVEKEIRVYLENNNPISLTENKAKEIDSLVKHIQQTPDLFEVYRVSKSAEEGKKSCDDPDSYFFWDEVHPSKIVHHAVGKLVTKFIEEHYQRN